MKTSVRNFSKQMAPPGTGMAYTYSTTAVELLSITWSELQSAGFTAGNQVMILVTGVLGNTSTANYGRLRVGFGTTFSGRTDAANSLNSIEPAMSASSGESSGAPVAWMTKRNLTASENIYVSYWTNTSTQAGATVSIHVFCLDDFASTSHWAYATATHTGNAATTYGTLGASITLPSTGTWLIMGTGYWLDDSTTADAYQSLLVGATTYGEHRRQGEDTENSWSIQSYYCGTQNSGTVVRFRYKVGTATTHDCTESKLFAMRLDQFAAYWGVTQSTSYTISATYSNQTYATSGTLTLPYAADVMVVSAPVFTVTDATKKPKVYSRFYEVDELLYDNPFGHNCVNTNGTTDKVIPAYIARIPGDYWGELLQYYREGDPARYSHFAIDGVFYETNDVSPTFTSIEQTMAVWVWDKSYAADNVSVTGLDFWNSGTPIVGNRFAVASAGDTWASGSPLLSYPISLTMSGVDSFSSGTPALSDYDAKVARGMIVDDYRSGKITHSRNGVLYTKGVRVLQDTRSDSVIFTPTHITLSGGLEVNSPSLTLDNTNDVDCQFDIRFWSCGTGDYAPPFTMSGRVLKRTLHQGELSQWWLTYATPVFQERLLNQEWAVYSFSLAQGQLNQSYLLDVATLRTKTLDQSWSQRLWLYDRSLDQEWLTYVDQGVPFITLDMSWQNHSSRWLTEVLGYVNAERASQGITQMITLYDGNLDEADIAHHHSKDIADTGIYAHESPFFPYGWRTLDERTAHMPGGSQVRENLQLWSAAQDSDLDISGLCSPYEAYLSWKNSPIHHANYMNVWGSGAIVKMLLGLKYFFALNDPPGVTGTSNVVITQVFLNMGRPDAVTLKQSTLDMSWVQTGALLETYNMLWECRAYQHVKVRHDQIYALKVAAQVTSPYGVRASIGHEQPIHYGVSRSIDQPYEGLHQVVAQVSHKYDIQLRTKIGAQVSQPITWRVCGSVEQGYSIPRVLAQVEQGYRIIPGARASSVQKYGDEVRAKAQVELKYDLMLRNPVKAQSVQFFSMYASAAIMPSETMQVKLNGVVVEIVGGTLSMDEGDYAWRFEAQMVSTASLVVEKGDMVEVTLGSGGQTEVWNLVVDSREITRNSASDFSFSISAYSPAYSQYGSDRVAKKDFLNTSDSLVSAIATSIIPTLMWGAVDWVVPAFRFAVKDSTPIQAIGVLVDACGAMILSDPSGQLRVVPRHSAPGGDYSKVTPDMVLTDMEDNLSSSDSSETFVNYNKFRIMSSNDAFSDTLEWVQDENDFSKGEVRVFPEPWRSVDLSANTGVLITSNGVARFSFTQQVEVVDGVASLQYPAIQVTSYSWLTDALGTPVVNPREKSLRVPGNLPNYGYGVLSISYDVEYYSFSVVSAKDVGQFLVIGD